MTNLVFSVLAGKGVGHRKGDAYAVFAHHASCGWQKEATTVGSQVAARGMQ